MKTVSWPFLFQPPLFPDAPGQFGAVRSRDVHSGVDLYCRVNEPVIAMEAGTVVGVEPFTGAHVPDDGHSPWWKDTWAVLVEGASGVIVYGELRPAVAIGTRVEKHQDLGNVLPVLRTFKGRPMVMLHVELLVPGSRASIVWWRNGKPCPEGLLDPTPLLREAAGRRARTFDLGLYDGTRYRDPDAPVDIKYAFGEKLRRT